MRGGVDEIGERDESGGEADCGPVESGDEDFGVRVEGVCYFEVVGDEVFEGVAADVDVGGEGAGDCYVGAAGEGVSMGNWLILMICGGIGGAYAEK